MALQGGSEEVARFLRHYSLPPQTLYKLHHLQVSSDAFSMQPAEILRLIGLFDEEEILTIASDWREYSSKGYSPSYIDRLLDDFNVPNALIEPSGDMHAPTSASFVDISSPVPSKPVKDPIAEKSEVASDAQTVPGGTLEVSRPATPRTLARDKRDLIEIIKVLRELVDQRSEEIDQLRMKFCEQVEEVEQRAQVLKEARDDRSRWKKAARESESKFRQMESQYHRTAFELTQSQEEMAKMHRQFMEVQETLQSQYLVGTDFEYEILSLQEQLDTLKSKETQEVATQYDRNMLQAQGSVTAADAISIDPVDTQSSVFKTKTQGSISNNNNIHPVVAATAVVEVATKQTMTSAVKTADISTNTHRATQAHQSTDTRDLQREEDFVPTSNRITVAKDGSCASSIVVQDPWPSLSYAQLLDKYRTLEDESTIWQKKQYQDLVDAESEVRRLQVVYQEQQEQTQMYKDKYDRLLVSSMSEISNKIMEEKTAAAAENTALRQQQEALLSKISLLQETIAQQATALEEKDQEIRRLSRVDVDDGPTSSRLPENITDGERLDLSSSQMLDERIESWSRERSKEKQFHGEQQERHRWEEKEKLYLLNMDYLSTSLKELTAAFHQQQEQLQQLLPSIHSRPVTNNNNNSNQVKNDAISNARMILASSSSSSKPRPVPPPALATGTVVPATTAVSVPQQSTVPTRPKTSHGALPSSSTSKPPSKLAISLPEKSSLARPAIASTDGKRSSAFPHKHRALKSTTKATSEDRPRNNNHDDSIIIINNNNNNSNDDDDNDAPGYNVVEEGVSLFYEDNSASDDDQVVFIEHREQPQQEEVTTQEQKQLDKAHKDALLTKAYDSESLKKIYFHPTNLSHSRPTTTGNRERLAGNSSSGSRPSSSTGYKSKDTRKSNKLRPRSSLVADFIQGLEVRYQDDLARMIQAQQQEDAPFYDKLALSVGKTPNSSSKDSNRIAQQQENTEPSHVPTTNYERITTRNSSAKKSRDKSNAAAASTAVYSSDLGPADDGHDRGNKGGGFFITVVPSGHLAKTKKVVPQLPTAATAATAGAPTTTGNASQAAVSNNEDIRSYHPVHTAPNQQELMKQEEYFRQVQQQRQQQQQQQQQQQYSTPSPSPKKHRHRKRGVQMNEEGTPLTSYPMSTGPLSVSSADSSTVRSSQGAPSPFSSPSMVLHPSNSEQQLEDYEFYHAQQQSAAYHRQQQHQRTQVHQQRQQKMMQNDVVGNNNNTHPGCFHNNGRPL